MRAGFTGERRAEDCPPYQWTVITAMKLLALLNIVGLACFCCVQFAIAQQTNDSGVISSGPYVSLWLQRHPSPLLAAPSAVVRNNNSPEARAKARQAVEDREAAYCSPTNLTEMFGQESMRLAYETFKGKLDHQHGTNDVMAAIGLVSSANELVAQLPDSGEAHLGAVDDAVPAWRLAIRIYRGTESEEGKRLFLQYWDRSLARSVKLVAPQLFAWSQVWEPTLATDELWRQLSENSNKRILEGISYVLAEQGDQQTLTRFGDEAKRVVEPDARRNMTTALNWGLSRLQDAASPGLIHLGPEPQPFPAYLEPY